MTDNTGFNPNMMYMFNNMSLKGQNNMSNYPINTGNNMNNNSNNNNMPNMNPMNNMNYMNYMNNLAINQMMYQKYTKIIGINYKILAIHTIMM